MSRTISLAWAAAFALAAFPVRANLEPTYWIFHAGREDIKFPREGASHRGSPMVALADIAKRFSLTLTYDPASFEITLANPARKNSLKLRTHSPDIDGSFWKAKLSRPVEFANARALVPIDFGDRALRPLLTGIAPTPASTRALPGQVDVVIDPGHGGNDYGATYTTDGVKLHEKDLVLQASRELLANLQVKGVSAALTRENDAFVTLPERTRFANQIKAKVFVSVHLNSDPSAKSAASGFEIYVLSLSGDEAGGRATIARENQMIPEDSGDGASRALADLRASANLEASLDVAKVFRTSLAKTMKQARKSLQMGPFYVLYGADMPALLLELGYLTSAADRAFFMNDAKRAVMVESLSSALAEHLKKGINKP